MKPDSPASAAQDPPPPQGPDAEQPPPARGWSGLPVAASLALVAFAVLFGIYGPRVVDRANAPLGIPVWELANAAFERHRERVRLAETSAEQTISRADAEVALADLIGSAVTVPDLSSIGFGPLAVRPISLPGAARSAIVLYTGQTESGRRNFVSVALVPDREQFVVYSAFGKPAILPIGEPFAVEPEQPGFGDVPSMVWSDGNVIRILHSPDSRTLEAAERLIRSSGPRRAGSDASGGESSNERPPESGR